MTDRQRTIAKRDKTRLKKLVNLFINLFGKKSKKSFSSVISHLVDAYAKESLISVEEQKMFRNIASFGDKVVSQFMTPRTDINAVKQNTDLKKLKSVIAESGHSRIPVFRNNFDDIVGFVHSKDLSQFLCGEEENFSINKILRKILFVPGSMKLIDVMLKMRVTQVHLAIVLDEFGGVDGIITIENIMEEIVGEIEDEHDIPSESHFFRIKKVSDQIFQFGGRVEIEDMEEALETKIDLDNDDIQTVSGLMMSLFSDVPDIGQKITKDDLEFTILDSNKRIIKLIEVRKIK